MGFRFSLLIWVGAVGCASVSGPGWAASPDAPSAIPRTLDASTYDAVKKRVALKPNDLNFQQVSWHRSVYEGLVESQREDRPLLLWLYFGGPRGAC